MAILIFVLSIIVLFVMATACRSGHAGLSELRNRAYAHRGLHGRGAPENSLAAFQRAVDAGYGIELDVHLLSDGQLAVIHDANLLRVTGQEGSVEDLRADDLQNYNLDGTSETIPLLKDVLRICAGKVPLIVELKCVQNNYRDLCDAACRLMDNYDGAFCMESFDPRCVFWLRKNRPDIIRGQLTENYFVSTGSKLPALLKFILRHQMLNFLTYPDFVAYRYTDRKTISNFIVQKIWKAACVAWTVCDLTQYNELVREDWIPIFEDFKP